jgi:hypothetical protein
MKFKKTTKRNIIIGIIAVLLISAFFYFQPFRNTVLNNGGRGIIDAQLDTIVYDPLMTSSITLPFTSTVYFGSGFDDACFMGATYYFLKKDTTVYSADRVEYWKPKHNADLKNKPFITSGTFTIDISKLENGEYTIDMRSLISYPSGDLSNFDPFCEGRRQWLLGTEETNKLFNFQTQPMEWYDSFSHFMLNSEVGSLKLKFLVQKPNTEQPKPEFDFKAYMPIALGILVVILGAVAYLRIKGKKKR